MKEIICIVCPNGCRMQISKEGKDIEVKGAKCPKGKEYAIAEMTDPRRSIASTVKTIFEDGRVLPVRTDGEVPKDKIFELMKMINKVVIKKRIKRGDIILQNVFDTGVNVIATSSMLQKGGKNE
ncbi:MAG: DUF1667 domain-containing protein [Bacillota bacterium]